MESRSAVQDYEDGGAGVGGGSDSNKPRTKCGVILQFNKYADHAVVEPNFDDLVGRLNAYMLVAALLIALLVTLLPIARADLQEAFAWTAEDDAYWEGSVWSTFVPLSSARASLENALRSWVMATCLLISSLCVSVFCYVQLIAVNKKLLTVWYSYFKGPLLVALWTLIFGLIVFFWSCAYWIQIMGGAKGLDMFISGFVGTVIPVAIFGICSPFVNAFINAGVLK